MNAPCRCLSVVGVAALALGAASAAAHAEEITITFASYGGALQRAEEAAWLQPFQALHPEIKIAYDIVDPVKLKAMVEAGRVVWQVASVGPDFGLGSDENLLEKIDCGIVPCDQLQPSLYPTTGYRAAYATSGLAIGYNTTLLPAGKVPQGWVDFFDTAAFPGKRVVMMDPISMVFEQALLGDGVPADQLYPLDLDRAVKKLDSLGEDLLIAPSYQGCAELVAAGEAALGGCWTGRWYDLKEGQGAPLDVQWNQNLLSNGYLVIPRGAPHKDIAMQLIAFITSAERNADQSKYIAYGPANKEALDKVDQKTKYKLQTSYLDRAIPMNDIWHDENRAEVVKRYAEWRAGIN